MTKDERIQKWRNIMATCESSGIPVKKWCAENHVAPSNYYAIRKKLAVIDGEAPVLAEIDKKQLISKKTTSSVVVIKNGNASVEIDDSVSDELLMKIMKAAANV